MVFEECNICGKRFYDNGQKLKPRYARTQHEKTCGLTLFKKQKKSIKEWLDYTATKSQINIIYNFMEDLISQQNQAPAPAPAPLHRRYTPSPAPRSHTLSPLSNNITMDINDRESCSSAVSSASSGEWTSWKYDNKWYSYDKDNNVYDENGNQVGERIQDEFSEEWKLDYG